MSHALLSITINYGSSANATTASIFEEADNNGKKQSWDRPSSFAVPHGFFYNYKAFQDVLGADFKVGSLRATRLSSSG